MHKYKKELYRLSTIKPVWNNSCSLTKARLDDVFRDCFGYSSQVNPELYKGWFIPKSNRKYRGTNKFSKMKGPVKRPDNYHNNLFFQRFINTQDKDGYYHRYQLYYADCSDTNRILGGIGIKSRRINAPLSHSAVDQTFLDVSKILSSKQIFALINVCRRLRLNLAQLDILIDAKDGKVYLVDIGPIVWINHFNNNGKTNNGKELYQKMTDVIKMMAQESYHYYRDVYANYKRGLVSVIVAVYNTEKYIANCLKSILNQSYQKIEIIVVNDRSTDRTAEVVQRLVDMYPNRIKYLENKENRGAYYSKNRGLEIARGELIAFQDADDLSDPERIRKQVDLIQKDNLEMSTCHFIRVSSTNDLLSSRRYAMITTLYRRSALDRLGFFDDSRIGADAEMIGRLLVSHGVGINPEKTIYEQLNVFANTNSLDFYRNINETLYTSYLLDTGLTKTVTMGNDKRRKYGKMFRRELLKIYRMEKSPYSDFKP